MSINFYAAKLEGRTWAQVQGGPEPINLSNRNAADLLAHLGIEPEPCGSIGADALVAKCRRAIMGRPGQVQDPGFETTLDAEPGRATFIDCGRPEGYLRGRAMELQALAAWAITQKASVCWA